MFNKKERACGKVSGKEMTCLVLATIRTLCSGSFGSTVGYTAGGGE